MSKIKSKLIIRFGAFLFPIFPLLWSSNAYALSSFTTVENSLDHTIHSALIFLSSSLLIIPVGLILLIILKKRLIILQKIINILSLKFPYSTYQSSSNYRNSSSYSDYGSSIGGSFGGGDSGGGGAGGNF